MTYFKVACGISAVTVSFAITSDQALRLTVFLLGIFILSQAAIEAFIISLPESEDEEDKSPFSLTAKALVTIPAVILGLLAALASAGKLTVTIKVAAVSLTTALLLGVLISGFASMQGIDSDSRSIAIKVVFNLTLWALALGVLGIAMGIVYRN